MQFFVVFTYGKHDKELGCVVLTSRKVPCRTTNLSFRALVKGPYCVVLVLTYTTDFSFFD